MKVFMTSILLAVIAISGAVADSEPVAASEKKVAIASQSFVEAQIQTRVGLSAESVQTMAGKYTVSGQINVPTPDMPTE